MRQRIAVHAQYRRAAAADDGADFDLRIAGLDIELLKTFEHYCLPIASRTA
jgi:hypothetical protein